MYGGIRNYYQTSKLVIGFTFYFAASLNIHNQYMYVAPHYLLFNLTDLLSMSIMVS